MNRIELRDGALTALVYPDYGGMAGRLILDGVEVLHLDEARLPEGAVLAGGIPVLFPFPGRTREDRYELDGRAYRMPFHGLVRDSAFGVEKAASDSVTLVRTGCREWLRDCYPFDFELRLTYALAGGALRLTAQIRNKSDRPMPHAFGWHPYFPTTDKRRARLTVGMARCERWSGAEMPAVSPDAIDLTDPTDYVCQGRTGEAAEILSPADGYGARIIAPAPFGVLVVCAKFPGTTCVEPWMGLPGAINTRENLEWVAAGEEARYDCRIEPYLLG
jgi:galactose mutarotase-like enzyme